MQSLRVHLLQAVAAAAILCASPALADDASSSSASAAASSAPAAAPAMAPVPQNDDLNAVLWDQTSVEFKAVTTGEYALAKMRLDQALADKTWTAAEEQTGDFSSLPPAVILDVDDTVVNTSAYQAWTVVKGTTYSGKTWGPYVAAEQDVAIPGALDFTKYAAGKGVTVFYVTNRTADQEAPTKEEMTKMGFPDGGSVDTYLMSKEQPDWTSAKGTRRAFIAKNYRVLLLLGDNMGDFTDKYTGSVADRDTVYQAEIAHWGHDWIALPNPTYGSFQSAPFLTDYSKSADEQRKEIEDALHPWAGPTP
jgi:acid phosphatase